jgi:hypothetical protein
MAKEVQSWYEKAADKMVRENKMLVQVANEMELAITSRELLNIEKTKAFQQILWTARNAYYKEIASDPERTKYSMLGAMTLIVQKLMEEGKWDKAAEAILKLAKIEGWVGTEGNINVFAGLSDKQLEEIERKVTTLASESNSGSKRVTEKIQ